MVCSGFGDSAVVHPGEMVLTEILLLARLRVLQAALKLNISVESLAELVCGRTAMPRKIAVALAREFGYSRDGWFALQRAWDDEKPLVA